MGLVYGVGINNYAGHISVNGKHNYDYTCWKGVLRRCYSDEYHENHPTYKGCSISDEFLFFDCFRTFIVEQKGFNCVDEQGRRFALDKDLLSPKIKEYTRNTICFIPVELNSLLTQRHNHRGECLIGVRLSQSGKYIAQISRQGKRYSLGYYPTEIKAFYAYKEAKEDYIKELANKWKDQIDIRVYEALMAWVISIDD